MEKQIALVNKVSNRVVNILIVDNLDANYIAQFETNDCKVIAVEDSIPYVNGLWDGEVFIEPTNDYLIELNLIKPVDES